MVTTRPPKTIVKPTALGPGANTDTKLLIYGLFQKGRVLAQDGSSLSESRVSAFSAISRIKGIAWNTVARWLEKAAQVCRRFNHRRIAWLRCQRASSRRDPHVHGQQEDAELGLRYDRGLVSALAIDGDGKAKLPCR